jgi:hypothetical protein
MKLCELKIVEESYTMDGVVSCGPWGGAGGAPFYDGRGDIVEIDVIHSAEHILSIETSYSQGGASFKAAPHGTSTGGQTTKVQYSLSHFSLLRAQVDLNMF